MWGLDVLNLPHEPLPNWLDCMKMFIMTAPHTLKCFVRYFDGFHQCWRAIRPQRALKRRSSRVRKHLFAPGICFSIAHVACRKLPHWVLVQRLVITGLTEMFLCLCIVPYMMQFGRRISPTSQEELAHLHGKEKC